MALTARVAANQLKDAFLEPAPWDLDQELDIQHALVDHLPYIDTLQLDLGKAITREGFTCLHLAARALSPHIVKWLLALGCDPNVQDKAGDTPMHLACDQALQNSAGALSVLELLASCGGNLKAVNKRGQPVIARAPVNLQNKILALLRVPQVQPSKWREDLITRLKEDDEQFATVQKVKPLRKSANRGSLMINTTLAASGRGPDTAGPARSARRTGRWSLGGGSPLKVPLASHRRSGRLTLGSPFKSPAKALFPPAPVNVKPPSAFSSIADPAERAAAVYSELVKLFSSISPHAEHFPVEALNDLLRGHSDLLGTGKLDLDRAMPDSTASLLHASIWHRKPAVVRALLDAKASPNVRNQKGDTPLHLACETAEQGGGKEIITLLIAAGGDPMQANNAGATPVDKAPNAEIREFLHSLAPPQISFRSSARRQEAKDRRRTMRFSQGKLVLSPSPSQAPVPRLQTISIDLTPDDGQTRKASPGSGHTLRLPFSAESRGAGAGASVGSGGSSPSLPPSTVSSRQRRRTLDTDNRAAGSIVIPLGDGGGDGEGKVAMKLPSRLGGGGMGMARQQLLPPVRGKARRRSSLGGMLGPLERKEKEAEKSEKEKEKESNGSNTLVSPVLQTVQAIIDTPRSARTGEAQLSATASLRTDPDRSRRLAEAAAGSRTPSGSSRVPKPSTLSSVAIPSPSMPADVTARLFKKLDIDGNGYIGVRDLKKILAALREDVTDEEVAMMLQLGDRSGNGQISRNDFVRLAALVARPADCPSLS